MKYHKIGQFEMKPDLYGGETCDQLEPRWDGFFEGDEDGDIGETITLVASTFSPGTKILIFEPECPKCQQVQSICKEDDSCDFDWHSWIEEKYS